MVYHKLTSASRSGSRLEQLKMLKTELAEVLEGLRRSAAEGDFSACRQFAPLSKEYRETIREIEEIEGVKTDDDEIAAVLEGRAADGKPGAVRPSRSRV